MICFVLFTSQYHLTKFGALHLNICNLNMKFSFKQERNGKLSFLDAKVSLEVKKFVTTVYQKPTFSGVSHIFFSFLPSRYKSSFTYFLVFKYFLICSDYTKFHNELSFSKGIFKELIYSMIH